MDILKELEGYSRLTIGFGYDKLNEETGETKTFHQEEYVLNVPFQVDSFDGKTKEQKIEELIIDLYYEIKARPFLESK